MADVVAGGVGELEDAAGFDDRSSVEVEFCIVESIECK